MITIVHLITGLETGGAERMLCRLVARTDRDRFRSLVVSITGAGSVGLAFRAAGVEPMILGLRRGLPDPRGLFRLDRILRKVRPDILQTWLYHADFLGLLVQQLGHAPHLLWNIRCSDLSLASVSPVGAALRRMLSWCSATPDAVIVNSRAGQRFHEQIGYRPRRWEYLPNGFDTDELRPNIGERQRLRAELGIDDDTIVIGLPARYHPMKDHRTFLAAAAILATRRREVCFVLVGAGTEPANRALVGAMAGHRISDRVRLLGERSDMAAIYAVLDITTLSSACGEGFPNVLGEAMACGLPCVATDNGDAADLLGPTGMVVPPRNPRALAAAWEALIALGPEARRSRGRAARARIIRDYGLGSTVARYEALYEDIVGQGDARRTGLASPSNGRRAAVSGR
jgi:glycosyltransferase involved in cell wall biosynthesis